MATRVEGMIEDHDRKKKYDWDAWLDGGKWLLVHGVDFEVSPGSFRMQVYQAAGNRGLKARTQRMLDDKNRVVIAIQARPKTVPGPATPRAEVVADQNPTP